MNSRLRRLTRARIASLGVSSAMALVLLGHPTTAHACGGCFHPPEPSQNASVVTDHRMAVSVSTTQTVLWDQIQYQGNPSDFAWVLPVGQGAYVELARDEWLAALDAISAPLIYSPPVFCASPAGGGGGGGFGCSAANSASFADGGASADASAKPPVQVISQDVVGPYLAVTIRSTSGEAITAWLTANGYNIPANIQPILDAYTNEAFDFIALRLAPAQGVQAMQPVRVVTPGADPSLPLRMVAAGIGASVGLTLYVISEGRYEPTNFPSLLIDRSKVVWDPYALRSNYAELFDQTVASGQGWVTESSGNAFSLEGIYKSACFNKPDVAVPCDVGDAGADAAASDAAASDAALDDASVDDAAVDGSTAPPDAGSCVQYVPACDVFTDYAVATTSLSPYDIRVTRLRTTLPAAALAVDLSLGASADQSMLTNTIQTASYTDPSYDPCPPQSGVKQGCGCETAGEGRTVASASLGLVALLALARRRRRRSRLDA